MSKARFGHRRALGDVVLVPVECRALRGREERVRGPPAHQGQSVRLRQRRHERLEALDG